MFCQSCGKKLPDGVAFCSHCGQKLPNRAAPSTTADPAPALTPVSDNTAPSATPNGIASKPPEASLPIAVAPVMPAEAGTVFCQACGAEIARNADFCPKCGTPNAENPASAGKKARKKRQVNPSGISPILLLILGILAVALPFFLGSIFGGLAGIILGIIGLLKANQYNKAGGPPNGKVNIGKIMSVIGIVLGIIALISGIISTVAAIIALIRMISALPEWLELFANDPSLFFQQIMTLFGTSMFGYLLNLFF